MQSKLKKRNYIEWFKKAEEDELSINAILKENGAPSTVCFLAQQMVEKYLKGLLVFHGKHFKKMHDLLGLETLFLVLNPDINKVHESLVLLNRYYITTRYPGDYPEFSMKDAREAYEAALRVRDFVLAKIGNKDFSI